LRILSLLDELELLVEEAKVAPLSSAARIIVDRAAVLDLIEEIRFNLPDVIRQAEQVAHQRQRILSDADAEGKAVVDAAHAEAEALVREHTITTQAYAAAEEMLKNAQSNAREVRMGAMAYADDVMEDIETLVSQKLSEIRRDREELKGD